jgi:hypothetical protein
LVERDYKIPLKRPMIFCATGMLQHRVFLTNVTKKFRVHIKTLNTLYRNNVSKPTPFEICHDEGACVASHRQDTDGTFDSAPLSTRRIPGQLQIIHRIARNKL